MSLRAFTSLSSRIRSIRLQSRVHQLGLATEKLQIYRTANKTNAYAYYEQRPRSTGHLRRDSAEYVDGLMETYVPATEQPVTEIIVRDISRSVHFYVSHGFHSFRKEGDFAEQLWEGHRLFVVERSAFSNIAPTAWGDPSRSCWPTSA